MPATLAELEAALDGGRLLALMAHRQYWLARRMGPTEESALADAWRVPIRVGLDVYVYAEPHTLGLYRIRPRGARAKPQIRPVGRPLP